MPLSPGSKISAFLNLCILVSLHFCIPSSLHLCNSPILDICISVALHPASVHRCLPACMPFGIHGYLRLCVSASPPVRIPDIRRRCISACMCFCIAASLCLKLAASLPFCFSAFLHLGIARIISVASSVRKSASRHHCLFAFLQFGTSAFAPTHHCISASLFSVPRTAMRLCVSKNLRLCLSASRNLCISASRLRNIIISRHPCALHLGIPASRRLCSSISLHS